MSTPAAALAVTIGLFTGVGAFSFGYAKGFSYLSRDPEACANCHVMQGYLDSWLKSSHHHAAVCADCHLPHHPIGKWIAKADNGFFHSLAFTLDNFPEPIRIKPRNRRITQENCIACHEDVVDQMRPVSHEGEMLPCIHCHADVGHGPR